MPHPLLTFTQVWGAGEDTALAPLTPEINAVLTGPPDRHAAELYRLGKRYVDAMRDRVPECRPTPFTPSTPPTLPAGSSTTDTGGVGDGGGRNSGSAAAAAAAAGAGRAGEASAAVQLGNAARAEAGEGEGAELGAEAGGAAGTGAADAGVGAGAGLEGTGERGSVAGTAASACQPFHPLRIVDKMLRNLWLIGYIDLLLPRCGEVCGGVTRCGVICVREDLSHDADAL